MAYSPSHSAIHAHLTAPPSLRRYRIPQEYVIFAIMAVIFIQSSSVIHLLLGSGGPVNVVKQAVTLPLIAIIAWYRRHFLRGALAVPELSGLLALVILSYLWSVSPDRWASAIVSQVIMGATAITLGSMMSMRGLLYALAALLLVSAVCSLGAVAVFPEARSSGESTWAQTWRGVYGHKNAFGLNMGVAVILTVTLYPLTSAKARKYLVAGGLLALFLLVHSESLSAQALTLIILGALGLRYFLRKSMALWAVVVLLMIGGLFAVAAFVLSTDIAQPIFDILGRKPTLSGRIPLWALSMDAVGNRPWLGYGFFSFWDEESARVIEIARHPTLRFVPYYSHNGAVEILLNLGIVGLALTALMILRCIVAYFRVLNATGEATICVVYLSLVIAFVLSNVMEAPILSRNALIWVLFMAIATRLCLTSRLIGQDRKRRRAGPRATPASGAADMAGSN